MVGKSKLFAWDSKPEQNKTAQPQANTPSVFP